MFKNISTLLNKYKETIFKEKRFVFEEETGELKTPKAPTMSTSTPEIKETAEDRSTESREAASRELENILIEDQEDSTRAKLSEDVNKLSTKLSLNAKQTLFEKITNNTEYARVVNPAISRKLLDFYSTNSKPENFTNLVNFLKKGDFQKNLKLIAVYCDNKNLKSEIDTLFTEIAEDANLIKYLDAQTLNILLKDRDISKLSNNTQAYLINSNTSETIKTKIFGELIENTRNLSNEALKELLEYSKQDKERFNKFVEKLNSKGRDILLLATFENFNGGMGEIFKLNKQNIEFKTQTINEKGETIYSQRSFRRTKVIEDAILSAKSPEEMTKICYEHLLSVTEDKDAKKIENYKGSNEFIRSKISEFDNKSQAPTVEATAEAAPNKPTTETKPAEAQTAAQEAVSNTTTTPSTAPETTDTASTEITTGTHKLPAIEGLRGAPDFYLTRNADGSKRLEYKRPFIGDDFVMDFPKGTYNEEIKSAIKDQEEKVRAEMKDFDKYANINLETGEIRDRYEKFKISDQTIARFSKDEFLENLDNIEGNELMVGELATRYNIQRQDAEKIIYSFIENRKGETSLADALLATKDLEGAWNDAEFKEDWYELKTDEKDKRSQKFAIEFQENWVELKALERQPENEENKILEKELRADLRKKYEIYLSAKKVMETLSKAKYQEKTKESDLNKHEYYVNKAEGITETTEDKEPPLDQTYFSLPEGKMEDFKFKISPTANKEFRDAYAKSLGLKNADTEWIQPENIVDKVLLTYNYNIDELISIGSIKKSKDGLVLVKIPQAIIDNATSPALKPIFERVNEKSIGIEAEFGELDQPDQKESEKIRVKEIQKVLETRDSYENSLIEAFKKYSKEHTEDTTEWNSWFVDAESKSIDPTLRSMDKQYYEIVGNVFGREITDEVAAIQMLDQPEVKIGDRTIKLYDINQYGAKTYNKENVQLYLTHLVKLGQKQKEFENIKNDKNYNPETVLEDYENSIESELAKQGIADVELFKKEFNASRDEYFRLAGIKNPSTEEKNALPGAKYKYNAYKRSIDNAVIAINKAKRANEARPLINDNPNIFNLNTEEVRLIKKGYLFERNSGDIKEELEAPLSDNPKIKEIQNQLLEGGYPASELGKVESTLLAAGAISMEGSKLTGGGIAFPVIDLGDGYKVAPVASSEGMDLGLSFDVYKSEESSAEAIAAVGIGPLGPRISVGYIQNINAEEAFGKGVDFQTAFGLSVSASPGASLTVGLAYNEERRTFEVFERQRTHENMREIDTTTDLNKKVELLRNHETFKEIAGELTDEQLLYVYNTWKSIDAQNANKEAEAPKIKGIQAGLMITPFGPGLVAAITFEIGEVKLIQPSIKAKEKIAENSVNDEITNEIYDKIVKQSTNWSTTQIETQFYTYDSPELYMAKDGSIGILKKDSQTSIKIIENYVSNLELMKEELHKVELDADIRTIEINGEQKQVLELNILNIKNKDVEVMIDPDTAKALNIVLSSDNRILIPGNTSENLRDLIITSAEFNYRYKKTEGGAATTKTVVITNNKNYTYKGYNMNRIKQESKNMLVKKWEDGAHSTWEIAAGENTGAIERINTESKYENGTLKWDFKDFNETIDTSNIPLEELKDVYADTNKMKENFHPITEAELQNQESRFTSGNKKQYQKEAAARNLYKEIEQDLKNGNPRITDNAAIIAAVNKNQKTPLNEKEAGEFLTFANHEYFVNIWKSDDTEKIKKAFDSNNEWISENVLIPEYVEIGYTVEEANEMAKMVAEEARKSFTEQIEKHIDDIDNVFIKPLEKDTIFASGTSIRETKEGVLAGALHTMEFEGIPQMGIIGDVKKWDINDSNETKRNIARATMEMLNKEPNPENTETFHEPITIKLAAFEGTRVALGNETYEKLTEFYSLNKEEQKNRTEEFKDTLTKFKDFYDKVITAITENKGILDLGDGQKIKITSTISTGAYGKCGNLSSMLDIDFTLMVEVPNQAQETFIAVSAERNVGVELETENRDINVVFGIAWRPEVEDIPPPPEEEGKNPDLGPSEPELGEGKTSAGGPAKVQTKSHNYTTDSGKGSTGLSPSSH